MPVKKSGEGCPSQTCMRRAAQTDSLSALRVRGNVIGVQGVGFFSLTIARCCVALAICVNTAPGRRSAWTSPSLHEPLPPPTAKQALEAWQPQTKITLQT